MPEPAPVTPPSTPMLAFHPLDTFYREDGRALPEGTKIEGADIPQPHRDLLVHDRDMTLTLRAFYGEPIHVRIGINTGPVVAGVIGKHKFIYDLWGDAVNTASRMESNGMSGVIQVTESTYQKLRDQYIFKEREPIHVKGKGQMVTYLLDNPVQSTS